MKSIFQILEDSQYYVYQIDSSSCYVNCNALFSSLVKVTPKALIGKKAWSIFKDAITANKVKENNLRALLTGEFILVSENYRAANGRLVRCMAQKIPLHRRGKLIGILSLANKVTEKQALNQNANLLILNHIVANLPGHVYWKDKEGVYLGCNDNQANSLGLAKGEDVVGKTDFELPWEQSSAEKFRQNDLEVMRTGQSLLIEEPSIVDSRPAIVLSHKIPLRDENGETIGVLGISIDITKQKEAEIALRQAKEIAETANKAKTEFLENIRHDLRTPLTGIVGFSSLIKSEAEKAHNTKIGEYADNVEASSQALLELLNEVLEAMRIASGERPLLKKKFNLKSKLEQVINLNISKAHQKHLELTFSYDENIPKFLIGDPQRIQRIVLELIANALNFTDEGKIEVVVNLAKINKENGEVIIKIIVADTGMGIPANRKEEIFERFKRLTPSYEGTYKGLGLGLAIVKQFIDDLGAEVFLETELRKGTKFICTIPLKQALLEESFDVDTSLPVQSPKLKLTEVKPSSELSPDAVPQGNIRVLLVEDDALAAQIGALILKNLGCHVDVVKDGLSAVEHSKKNSYDLVFMDVGLPKIDGKEASRRIREWESLRDKHTPIIALTAHIDVENKQSCIEAGMDAVLSKPLSKETANDILHAFAPKLATGQKIVGEKSKKNATKEKELKLPKNIIDLKLGAEIVGDVDSAKEMLKMLVDFSIPETMEELKKAYAEKDWAMIRKSVHKFYGGVCYCGTPRLKATCLNLKNCLEAGKTELQDELYKRLLTEMKMVISEYRKNKK